MTTTLLPTQRRTLHDLTRHHKGDTMLTFVYPIRTDPDPAPGWYIQRQLDTALQQARQEEQKTMTAQHTPGPWTTYADDNTLIGPAVSDGKAMIADAIGPLPAHPQSWRRPIAEVQANARLIAAAPELLEALRAVLVKLEGQHPDLMECAEARAAIAKATGEVAR